MTLWIDVDDLMPEPDQDVLAWDGREVSMANREGDYFRACGYGSLLYGVTHWMPLPEGPHAEEDRRQAEALVRWGWDHRCPRCGSTLNRSGQKVWCSFIGGGEVKPCMFGLDQPVTVDQVEATQEARP